MNDEELERLVFENFASGKTVNAIAKECTPLIQRLPDYKKRVQKVDNLKKKWKKKILAGFAENVSKNINSALEGDGFEEPSSTEKEDLGSKTAKSEHDYSFNLSLPSMWTEHLKEFATYKKTHVEWAKKEVISLEKEYYLEFLKAMLQDVRIRIKNGGIMRDTASLINLALKLAKELKKCLSLPNYMQESIAYLNMLKSEEGAISAGMIKKANVANALPANLESNVLKNQNNPQFLEILENL